MKTDQLTCRVTVEGGGPSVRTGRPTPACASCTHGLRGHGGTRAQARKALLAAHGPRLYIPDVAAALAPPGGPPLAESTIRGYMSRRAKLRPFPEPDGRDPANGRPWWWKASIDRWQSLRPGRGRRSLEP